MKYKPHQPISEREREEDIQAFVWLKKHGITDHEIRYFKWRYFDYDHKKLNINRTLGEIGNRTVRFIKTLNYAGTPVEKIAARNREKQRGKNIFVFYKEIPNPSYGFPSCCRLYLEDEIKDLVVTRKNANALWTFRLSCGTIEIDH